jgi:hypothetical protein
MSTTHHSVFKIGPFQYIHNYIRLFSLMWTGPCRKYNIFGLYADCAGTHSHIFKFDTPGQTPITELHVVPVGVLGNYFQDQKQTNSMA